MVGFVVMLAAALLAGADAVENGRSRVTWPLPADDQYVAAYTALAKRHGFKLSDNYAMEMRRKSQPDDPAYELYVPAKYDGKEKYGLLVWISAGGNGRPPREDWLRVLDRRKLIWVGPNAVGNDVDTLWRTYMAGEAARQAKEHFTIDPNRIYVAGVSGGGRIASHVALVDADIFTGGFYFVGCDFWRDIPVTPGGDKYGKFFRGFWRKPDGNLLRKARQNRFVLLTGEHDFNHGNTLAVYDGYQKDHYAHVTLLDVPGMGHGVSDAEWFEKGLKFLDEPTATQPPSTRPTTRATTRPTTRPKPTGKIIVGH